MERGQGILQHCVATVNMYAKISERIAEPTGLKPVFFSAGIRALTT